MSSGGSQLADMGANGLQIPGVIPQWEDGELYQLLYPKHNLICDVQGFADVSTTVNRYQEHLARAVDVYDICSCIVIFWTSSTVPFNHLRKGHLIWTSMDRLYPDAIEDYRLYIIDERRHLMQLPCDLYRLGNKYVDHLMIFVDPNLQEVTFRGNDAYQHHLGVGYSKANIQNRNNVYETCRVLRLWDQHNISPFQENMQKFFAQGSARPRRYGGHPGQIPMEQSARGRV